MPTALFLGWCSAFVKDCQEGGSGHTGRPGFKTCDRRALASSSFHGGSPTKCGRCSAAEVVWGCGVFMRKGVISHHFRALKKVERPRTAHFRKRQVSLSPFHIIGCPVVRSSLLGALGGRVAVQLVSQLLFNRILYWLRTGVRLYKGGRCGNDGIRPVQWVHDVILVS